VLVYPSGPSFTGLAYDPESPDHLFAALSTNVVQQSDDGGASWTDLPAGPSGIADLLLSPGGQALLAATQQGVWRIEP
jgi:hypothetical protein